LRRRRAMFLEVLADSPNRLVAAEIAHQRDEEIVLLHSLQNAEVVVARHVAVIVAGAVALHHQLGVGRKAACKLLRKRIPQVWTAEIKRAVYVLKAVSVVGREHKTMM